MMRKIISFILIIFSFFTLNTIVNADSIVEIKNIEFLEKSDEVSIIDNTSFNLDINLNVRFKNVGDYVKYKITIHNNDIKNYNIKINENDDKYIKYSFDYNELFESNKDMDLILTMTYENEVPDSEIKDGKYSYDSSIKLTLGEEELIIESSPKVEESNPQTLDNIIIFVIIAVVVVIAIIVLLILRKKINKKMMVLLIILSLFPSLVLATTNLSLNFNIGVEIEKEVDNKDTSDNKDSKVNLYELIKSSAKNEEIDFNINSKTSLSNGIYTTTETEGNVPVYYYRGARSELNNNVIFNNSCWKIIRTTETKGIKMIYAGLFKDGKCPKYLGTSIGVHSGTIAFNNEYYDNAHVGYMFGDTKSDNYEDTHKNVNDSNAKKTIDSWFNERFDETAISKLEDTVFCNDRSTTVGGENNVLEKNTYRNLGYGNTNTAYASLSRSSMFTINLKPSLVCPQKNDKFTVSEELGNGALTYPVGLITLDEVVFAGFNSRYSSNTGYKDDTNYLFTQNSFWTMTPTYIYNNKYAGLGEITYDGYITSSYAYYPNFLRPVISLKNNTLVESSQDGSESNPFIID